MTFLPMTMRDSLGKVDEAFGPDVVMRDSSQDDAAEAVGLFAGLFGGEAEVEGFEARVAGAAEAVLGWA